MSDDPAITHWLHQLQAGNQAGAQRLWETYYGKLVVLARRKLEGRRGMAADEEDVALSAFKSFCRGLENKRYPDLNGRDELWKLLVTITLHKALHLVRDENRRKRGGGWVQLVEASSDDVAIVEQLAGTEPTPEMAAQVAEVCEKLLKLLPSPEMVELAVMKMEGYTNQEIADKWGRAERTVERKLQLIRQLWSQEIDVLE